MDEVKVENNPACPGLAATPSHKITIAHGADRYVFWYTKGNPSFRDFDKRRDIELVKSMHAKGTAMDVGGFEIFTTQSRREYRLHRLNSHEFSIEVMKE